MRFANQGHKIFAIDVGNKEEAINWAKRLKENQDLLSDVFAIKIGLLDILQHGLSIINEISSESGLPVICDLKLSEIPSIAIRVVKEVAAAGAFGIVVQGFVGEEVLKAVQEVHRETGLEILLVSEMSHEPDGGFTHLHLEAIAELAKRYKVFGIIGPGNRQDRLTKIYALIKDSNIKSIATGLRPETEDEKKARKYADLLIEGHMMREAIERRNSIHSIEQPTNQVRPILRIIGIFVFIALIIVYPLYSRWPQLGVIGAVTVSGGFALTGSIIGFLVNRKHRFFR